MLNATVDIPMSPAPWAQRPSAQVLLSVTLTPAMRDGLNAAVRHYGLPSRAALIREASKFVIRAAEIGGCLTGHAGPLPHPHSGEGVYFPVDLAGELDRAVEQLGIRRGEALRWACGAVIAAHRREAGNGSH